MEKGWTKAERLNTSDVGEAITGGARANALRRSGAAGVATVSGTQAPPPARLLDTKAAAAYLHVSEFTARDWALQGFFPVVELPPRRPRVGERQKRAFRRLLVDREDLDRFIEARKRRLSE